MTGRAKIVPIILAAGSSKNLGVPKALARFGEKSALLIAIENCSGLERPIVVLGCDAERVRPGVPRAARVVVNRSWRKGQLSSLLRALERVPRSAAVLIYPVDHPLLEKQFVKQLAREFRRRKTPQEIVMPRHGRKYGHPIVISAELRNELSHAGTTREVVYRIPERIRIFEADTSAIYEDFDTPESYRKCLRKLRRRRRMAEEDSDPANKVVVGSACALTLTFYWKRRIVT
ncbi:MAG: nucleotidyltransferase family protein [Candidatus Acidiferrum sp.]